MRKKDESKIEGLCLMCQKGPPKKDKVVSNDKDFVCSRCTQILVAHPRMSGETIEDWAKNNGLLK